MEGLNNLLHFYLGCLGLESRTSALSLGNELVRILSAVIPLRPSYALNRSFPKLEALIQIPKSGALSIRTPTKGTLNLKKQPYSCMDLLAKTILGFEICGSQVGRSPTVLNGLLIPFPSLHGPRHQDAKGHMRVCTHIRMCIYIYIYMYMKVYAFMYLCMKESGLEDRISLLKT